MARGARLDDSNFISESNIIIRTTTASEIA
jgi:hypothetical protein